MQTLIRGTMYRVVVLVLLLVVAGCAQKKKKATSDGKPSVDIQEVLALHSEIPDMLLGFYVDKVIVDKVNPSAVEVVYKSKKKSNMTQEALKKSYLSDMELLGWQLVGEFAADDAQLLFQRPGNKLFCTVLIEGSSSIRVTLLPK